MEYMTTKEAVAKWNISERRIRQLLKTDFIKLVTKLEVDILKKYLELM